MFDIWLPLKPLFPFHQSCAMGVICSPSLNIRISLWLYTSDSHTANINTEELLIPSGNSIPAIGPALSAAAVHLSLEWNWRANWWSEGTGRFPFVTETGRAQQKMKQERVLSQLDKFSLQTFIHCIKSLIDLISELIQMQRHRYNYEPTSQQIWLQGSIFCTPFPLDNNLSLSFYPRVLLLLFPSQYLLSGTL